MFGRRQYELRINLAILDWNENIDRPTTSLKTVIDHRNPRRNVPRRILTKKLNHLKLKYSISGLRTFILMDKLDNHSHFRFDTEKHLFINLHNTFMQIQFFLMNY